MNGQLHYIYYFYFLGNAIRDALEYVSVREEYPLETFNAKKQTLELGLNENTPFDMFCKNNGEQGEKLRKEYKDFYETVYGSNSQFCKVIDGKVVVDHSLSSKVLRMTILLKASMFNVLKLHCENPENKPAIEEDFANLFEDEEKFFEVIAGMITIDYALRDRFKAFNEAKKNSQGVDTVESNFIQSELNDALGLFNFLRKISNDNGHKEFEGLVVYAQRGIDLISGKIKPEEGKTLEQEFVDIWQRYQVIVAQLEPKYKQAHINCWNQMREYEQEIAKSKQN